MSSNGQGFYVAAVAAGDRDEAKAEETKQGRLTSTQKDEAKEDPPMLELRREGEGGEGACEY